jgi:oligopeptide transport system permease protein
MPRSARVAAWFLALLGLLALLAPLLPLPSPAAIALRDRPLAPEWPWQQFGAHAFRPEYWKLSWIDAQLVELRQALFGDWQTGHWLGTDAKGRDLLARIVWGSRTSFEVALLASLTSLVIGVGWGAVAGFAGGRVDNAMMRFVDLCFALPFVFLVIFLIGIVNEYRGELESRFGIGRETVFFVLLGAFTWLSMARVVRGQVLALRKREFVEAARVLGASRTRILLVHLVPNVLPVVLVYLTLTVPAVMLYEAFLSFLGLGIEPPKVSWGLLAVEGAEALTPLSFDWWLVLWPSLAIAATLLALNVLGDALRDALDPRLSGVRR